MVASPIGQPDTDGGTAMHVVQAQYYDLDTVISILTEAAEWMMARGIRQWTPEQIRDRDIAPAIQSGEFFLGLIDGEASATLRLQWRYPAMWPDAADDAAYLHCLAVRRTRAGRGLGLKLLDWASTTAAASGKTCLRLDCMADNNRLRHYYEQAGFTCRGLREGWSDNLQTHWRAALYERKVENGE